MKRVIICKFQESTVQQLQRLRMSEPQSSQLSHTVNAIFGLPDDGASTSQNVEQLSTKMQQLEKRMIEPQVPIQGSNKRPKGKKNQENSEPQRGD